MFVFKEEAFLFLFRFYFNFFETLDNCFKIVFMNKRSIFLTLFCMERIDFFSFIIFYKSFFMKVFFL